MEEQYWKQFQTRQINDLFDLNDPTVERSFDWQEIAYETDLDILHEERTAIDGQHEVNIYHRHPY